MRLRRRRSGTTLLVLPTPSVAVGELYGLLAEEPGRRLLEAVGIVAQPGSAVDLSTALTLARTERVAGHPGATLAVSGDHESGYAYLRVLGPEALVKRAVPALDALERLLSTRYPALRIRRRR
ncbi:hypothetical protein [Herbiconiux ginsengi]|uniref:Uncharacterized protein n=1 Tax=Herbiconiux ginsengi TaxID=381665 RepID=A0A1H3SXK8_9MICO|nr:hypothetical protein [Herbiconiux ginsengi]SDZ42427.1 hypothetical protein SAMN05216554_3780 [Herbiconiux ginsengi]